MPRRELPPRIQSHLARVRLARIIAISFACLCLIVGVGVAAPNTTPGNHVARALNSNIAAAAANISETLAHISNIQLPQSQLAAASGSGIGERIRNIICWFLRNCPAETEVATSPTPAAQPQRRLT